MKKLAILVALGLSFSGCVAETANAFQLVGSMVQGGAAMGSSIMAAKNKEAAEKAAQEKANKPKTPEESQAEKDFKIYLEHWNKLVDKSPLYCKEEFKGTNKCIAVHRGKVLQAWTFYSAWSSYEGGSVYITDSRELNLPPVTQEEIKLAKEKGIIDITNLPSITEERFQRFRVLGGSPRLTIKDFKDYSSEFGGLRYGAVLQAVRNNFRIYSQIVGI